MAMITCPECGHHISSLAHTCPECGFPIDPDWASEEAAKVTKQKQEKIDAIPFTVESAGETIVEPDPEPIEATVDSDQPVAEEPQIDTPDEEQKTEEEPSEKTPKKSNGLKWLLGLVVVAGILFGAGYYLESQRDAQREQRDYEMLEGCTNPAFYEDFIIKYPRSKYIDDVRQRYYDAKETNSQWEEIMLSGDRQKIVNYVRLHPTSPYLGIANNMIDSIDWTIAKEVNSIASMDHYMDSHPDGLYYDQAEAVKRKIKRQEEEAARRDTTETEEAVADTTASTPVVSE